MSNAHNCSEIVAKVFLVLDGELTEQEERNLLTEINRCNHCLKRFNIEKTFKDFLVAKLQRKCISEQAIEDIKAQIRTIA